MIHDFVASWALFRDSYLTGWLIAVLLPMLGVLVAARDQVFLGAAVSQASLLGIAAALRLVSALGLASVSWIDPDTFVSSVAGLAAVLAALFTARGGMRSGDSHESITGFVFRPGASGAVLLMAHSPHGMEEIHRLLASTIIGATQGDVAVFAALVLATTALVVRATPQLLLLVMDPEMARSVGMRVERWNLGLAVWLGLVVGLSNGVAGAIFTFGCLVLPALTARSLCREVRTMFVVAPVVGLGSAVVAFFLAHGLDYPPGQTAAVLQCLALAGAWVARGARRTARHS
jgi:ABC-type Mn2+/Zn2+ transport system permease subunit